MQEVSHAQVQVSSLLLLSTMLLLSPLAEALTFSAAADLSIMSNRRLELLVVAPSGCQSSICSCNPLNLTSIYAWAFALPDLSCRRDGDDAATQTTSIIPDASASMKGKRPCQNSFLAHPCSFSLLQGCP
jgi:hypothetical protein